MPGPRMHELLQWDKHDSSPTSCSEISACTKDGIVEKLEAVGCCQHFVLALKDSGLEKILAGAGPYTVFAPIDVTTMEEVGVQSFGKRVWLKRAILERHIVHGYLDAQSLRKTPILTSISGYLLRVSMRASHVQGAEVVKTDLLASNGIVHTVSRLFGEELRANFAGPFVWEDLSRQDVITPLPYELARAQKSEQDSDHAWRDVRFLSMGIAFVCATFAIASISLLVLNITMLW